MGTVRKVLLLLTPKEKVQAFWLLCVICLVSVVDVIGLASLVPFLALFADPSLINQISDFELLRPIFEGKSVEQITELLLLGCLSIVIVSLLLKSSATFLQLKFSFRLEAELGARLVEEYLARGILWFDRRNSAELGKDVLSEVSTIIINGVLPLLIVVSNVVAVLTVMSLLILVDPILALASLMCLGTLFLILIVATKNYLGKIGEARIVSNEKRFKAVNEIFNTYKQILISGKTPYFVGRFREASLSYVNYQSSAQVLAQLPRYLLEALGVVGVLALVMYLSDRSGSPFDAIATLSVYAIAGYRILPGIQNIYANTAKLKYSLASVANISKELDAKAREKMAPLDRIDAVSTSRFERLEFSDVTFAYPVSQIWSEQGNQLQDISFKLERGQVIGITGTTGSGKSTLMDLMLGLFAPVSGSILVNGRGLTGASARSWQRLIGYVPQNVVLIDETVAANISFGEACQDRDRIEAVASVAELDSVIDEQLHDGLETLVGDQGSRLSGGQIQRIGIARALYSQPEVLVLDEATSALDNATEAAVIQGIRGIPEIGLTVMIAHRLSTIRACDKILFLEEGRLVGDGTYEQLLATSRGFKSLVEASS